MLLKLGCVGLFRLESLYIVRGKLFFYFFFGFFILSYVFLSFRCCFINDSKLLVANSSVVHIFFCFVGVFAWSDSSIEIMLAVMLRHGFCSSGLFYTCNSYYFIRGSRNFKLINCSLFSFRIFNILFLLMCLSNIRAPPVLSLIGEMASSSCTLNWDFYSVLSLTLIVFFIGSYCINLYCLCRKFKSFSVNPIKKRLSDYLIIVCH